MQKCQVWWSRLDSNQYRMASEAIAYASWATRPLVASSGVEPLT